MLLKFSTQDVLNSTLLHYRTAAPIYAVSTTKFFSRSATCSAVVLRRRTTIIDIRGGGRERQLAEIEWSGRIPSKIRIGDEVLKDVDELLGGCKSINVDPKIISVPTRLNNSWKATAGSLTLEDCNTGTLTSAFYQNSFLLNDRVIRAPFAGLGSDILVLDGKDTAMNVEILASFFIMEIIRRNHFNLAPHTFDKYLGPCPQAEDDTEIAGKPRPNTLGVDLGEVARRLGLKSL
ncbi:hypothetical protein DENSPDRAFT_835023 [Dentipellis sp. KUC8613]|nr:hypothetical protein DENSPDRAFT_835023 [Dentipellis sp. KUC8613]